VTVTTPAKSGLGKGAIAGIVCVALLGAAGLVYWMRQGPEPARAERAVGRPAVPVSVATAVKQDVPVVLTGLGTVQASFTVGIHSQVDGKLQEVLFTEGQPVKKGDVLAKIDPRLFQASLDQAKAKKAQDEATLAGNQKDLARSQALSTKGFDTQQNLDQLTAKVAAAQALVQADDAAIETAQTNLEYTNIVAPSDGRMGVRLVDPGNNVRATDTGSIAVLVRTKPTYVTFTLPAQTLDTIREAMGRGQVQVAAYDRDNKKQLSKGTLETIDNMIDQATASYKLKATFANDDEKLWPGEFVNARVMADTVSQAIVIPNNAVQRGPKGLFTWVVKQDNKAEVRPIETGLSANGITIVTKGLNDGERVVTDGQYKLQTGATVSLTPTAQPAS
jgi:membrane fusion protein, multidrug efflux system